ncbi:MAG: hypothetical protein J5733_01865 [Bacteroidaceae bacterium]|nr:hypothetical protein [Bacteroidaceae bacterium]
MTGQYVDWVLNLLGKANTDVEYAVADVYAEAGESVVDRIRSGEISNWHDITGNLRSSIGYAVCRKGRIIRSSDFEQVLNGAEGANKGRELCRMLASQYASYDFALIIVAGEEYAVYVEAVENRVVLAGGELFIRQNITRMLQERIRKVLKRYEK